MAVLKIPIDALDLIFSPLCIMIYFHVLLVLQIPDMFGPNSVTVSILKC